MVLGLVGALTGMAQEVKPGKAEGIGNAATRRPCVQETDASNGPAVCRGDIWHIRVLPLGGLRAERSLRLIFIIWVERIPDRRNRLGGVHPLRLFTHCLRRRREHGQALGLLPLPAVPGLARAGAWRGR